MIEQEINIKEIMHTRFVEDLYLAYIYKMKLEQDSPSSHTQEEIQKLINIIDDDVEAVKFNMKHYGIAPELIYKVEANVIKDISAEVARGGDLEFKTKDDAIKRFNELLASFKGRNERGLKKE